MPNLAPITTQIRVVDDNGYMTDAFSRWVLLATNMDMLVGTGSPEGVVDATQGKLYMDDAAASGTVLYVKQSADISGDRKQGWVLA